MGNDFVLYIKYIGIVLMCTQLGYASAILVLGKTMLEYYEWGYFKKTENLFQRLTNIFLDVTAGSGYYIYKALLRFPWIVRKLLFLLIYGIAIFVGMVVVAFLTTR
ncbi:hypothetical protein CUU64_06405 [Bacillus sp. V5-8f]|nr:hypothetical protein CUU64_06405 [Bacillus sp. V5-8f]